MKSGKYLTLEILIEHRRLESMIKRFGPMHQRVLRQNRKVSILLHQIQEKVAS